jgi:hypothetical protein
MKRLNQALLLLMLVSMVDTCVSSARTSPRVFPVIAGEAVPISGKLVGQILPSPTGGSLFSENRVSDAAVLAKILRVVSPASAFDIRLVERNGRLWRAILQVYPGTREGDYPIHVLQTGEQPGDENRYLVQVFANAAAKRHASPSILMRYLGMSPWWVGLALVPLVSAMLACSWRSSRSDEHRLRRKGIGVIYQLARRRDHWELIAGLGSGDGVRLGDRVFLLGQDLKPITDIRVESVHAHHLTGAVGLEVPVTPSCYVTCQVEGAVERGVEEWGDRT